MSEILEERGTLSKGVTIGDAVHKDFVMAPIQTMGQMFEAEKVADVSKPLTFEAAMICQQLKSIGDFTGPFSMEFISSLPPKDYRKLARAQQKLEALEADAGKNEASD